MDNSNNEPSREYILLKEEVDALQIALLRSNKPWYKETSSLVAIAALTLSIVTTFLTSIDGSQDRLRGYVKELIELPKEFAEINDKYQNNPTILAALSAQINQRNQVIAKLAADEMESIENNIFGSNIILPIEYITVANGLTQTFEYNKAKVYFSKASSLSDDYSVAVGALRSMANISLTENNLEEMRRYMSQALDIGEEREFINLSGLAKTSTDATTESQWAWGELQLNNCDAAKEHYYKAKQLISTMIESPIKQQLITQLSYTEDQTEICK